MNQAVSLVERCKRTDGGKISVVWTAKAIKQSSLMYASCRPPATSLHYHYPRSVFQKYKEIYQIVSLYCSCIIRGHYLYYDDT